MAPALHERLTQHAQEVIGIAREEAIKLHHSYIGTEHLLLGLVRAKGEGGFDLCAWLERSYLDIQNALDQFVHAGSPDVHIHHPLPHLRYREALKRADHIADSEGRTSITAPDLLTSLAMSADERCPAYRTLKHLGVVEYILDHGTSAAEDIDDEHETA